MVIIVINSIIIIIIIATVIISIATIIITAQQQHLSHLWKESSTVLRGLQMPENSTSFSNNTWAMVTTPVLTAHRRSPGPHLLTAVQDGQRSPPVCGCESDGRGLVVTCL